jgi:hypothetical protein
MKRVYFYESFEIAKTKENAKSVLKFEKDAMLQTYFGNHLGFWRHFEFKTKFLVFFFF